MVQNVIGETGLADTEMARPGLDGGVYSYREAARLLSITPRRLARWADGYSYPLRRGWGWSSPVLVSPSHEKGALSFRELMELFFVREFVRFGVRLGHVRQTAEALAREVGPFPFTRKRLLVSGRELLVRETEHILRRPDIGQLVADFAEDFVQHVEIDREQVVRYYPPEYGRQIFLDPRFRGGEPVIAPRAIPTRVVYALWRQEGDVRRVAEYFEIDEQSVKVAIRYEDSLRDAA